MGLSDQYQKEKSTERKDTFIGNLDVDLSSWFQVFSACLGKMMVIQNACSEHVVKGQDWNVDFSRGIISFGKDEYPMKFIGSESNSDNTWLWGWENINEFSDEIIKLAVDTKDFGKRWGLEPFTTAEIELDDRFSGHTLSIAACGLAGPYCYYRGPHSGGAVLVAFSGVTEQVFAPIDASAFVSLTMQCIQQFHVDQKIFVESLLLWNGTSYDWEQNKIIAHFPQDLSIEFEQADQFLRIRSMKTIVSWKDA